MLTSSRSTNIMLVAILAVGVAIVAMLASGVRGGPLDPTNPPGSTDGVREPGTPISSVPFAITQPGRYYLTRNLSFSGADAITVAADDVVVDLGGFTLDGNGVSFTGIYDLALLRKNVSVENGVIRRFSSAIRLGGTTYGHIRGVRMIGGTNGGIGVQTQQQGLLEDCEVSEFLNRGVELTNQSVMRRCYVHNNAVGVWAFHSTVTEDSIIAFNTTSGVTTVGSYIAVRNNRFSRNGGGSTDVIATFGVITAVDNLIHCETSVTTGPSGVVVTTGPGGEHPNIPTYAAAFCAQ